MKFSSIPHSAFRIPNLNNVFTPTDILLPHDDVLPELWSVVACDQFTSELEYWERVKKRVGDLPSTLNMIIPEVYLDTIDEKSEIEKIRGFMDNYVSRGIFREIKDSFIYVERTQKNGLVRKGLVGAIDLEEYDFSIGAIDENAATAAVIASEGTILDRLPPRIRVRQAALLELPHIMVLIADENQAVIEPLGNKTKALAPLYDFELMEGGGRLRGTKISGSESLEIMNVLSVLHEKKKAEEPPQCLMVVGDGNHSLAAAKKYWNEVKENASPDESKTHPARYALVEINNLYDPAICFEAIHRVVFDVDVDKFVSAIESAFAPAKTLDDANTLRVLSSRYDKAFSVDVDSVSELIVAVQRFLDEHTCRFGGRIDYIHDIDTLNSLAKGINSVGILLPAITKQEFLETVVQRRAFPRKSFSVGHAEDKRYYMECRRIEG